jgi:hypothetical protein
MHGVTVEDAAVVVRQAVNATATPRSVSASLRWVVFIRLVEILIVSVVQSGAAPL